ncbi:GGDEF domain-containing protein [Roseisolibacter sp. H3M3-2]|uniref:GGDEF domain-containing protein n=1 Tax=Roseisolibacter sp. H3M3-2 TaxID=3031323 RepID=UPI0023D9E25C|nr:GGDEF domain-containing protein [Roseisolibacter sp. H3M3-2]MDF1504771.1 GGDEF domain-containing protein [Roseisolibacter sp. H3M3-2]
MSTRLDALLHPSLRGDEETRRRAGLTVVLSLVVMGVALAYALVYRYVVGFRDGAVILAAGAAVGPAVLAMVGRRPWTRAAGHAVTATCFAVVLALVGREGGLSSLAAPWLVTPPLFAALLLGRRGAVGWTAACVAALAALYAVEARGVRFPTTYPPEWTERLTLGSHAGLVLCTALLLFVFESRRAAAHARAERATEALARLAYWDSLTGLANRARFVESLDGALARARADGEPARVAVLLLDLDGFKEVNDTMGHAAGDALLTLVGARLLSATRGCDTAARLGGDEFAVVLDGVRSDSDAAVVAERVVAALTVPFALAGGPAAVGASVGVARAGVGATSASLLHDADVAMYQAKALGRGRWVPHAPGMTTRVLGAA